MQSTQDGEQLLADDATGNPLIDDIHVSLNTKPRKSGVLGSLFKPKKKVVKDIDEQDLLISEVLGQDGGVKRRRSLLGSHASDDDLVVRPFLGHNLEDEGRFDEAIQARSKGEGALAFDDKNAGALLDWVNPPENQLPVMSFAYLW